jgi:hypothetical protein
LGSVTLMVLISTIALCVLLCCEGFTTFVFIAPPAALWWWEFRLGSDRTQRPG